MTNLKTGIVIITAPSGTGKGSVIRRMGKIIDYEVPVSATTRQPRPGELEGQSAKPYLFLNFGEFRAKIEAGDFAEWARYGNNYYGTLKSEVDRIQDKGCLALVECEVQGARHLKALYTQAIWIFLCPPGDTIEAMLGCLRQRLMGRNTDTPEQIRVRLEVAIEELKSRKEADYRVINHENQSGRAATEISRLILGD